MPSTDTRLQLAVLADCHLPIDTDHPDFDAFLQQLEHLHRQADTVVLLGDIFQVWAPGTVFDHTNGRRLLDAIRSAPGRTILLEGNWDFFLEHRLARSVEAHETDTSLTIRHKRIALAHGHLHTGWKDRLWMGLLKSAPARWLFSTRAVGTTLARKLNRMFARGAFSKSLPDGALRAMGERLSRHFPDADWIVCGHVHRPVRMGRVMALPDWYETGAFLGWPDGLEPGLYRVTDGRLTPAEDLSWTTL